MNTVSLLCETIAAWLNCTTPQDPGWPPETWETFQFVCRVHGVAPLLHQKLAGATWPTPKLRAWLAEQHTFNTQRIARMQAELSEILALFAANRLPLMPLKGSILAATTYPQPGLRPMADLDLLLRPENFEPGAALLARLGYEPDIAHWKHTEFSRPENRQVVSTTYEHPDNPRKLELHLHCRESFGGPTVELTELMWAQAQPGKLLGEPAILPHPAALWLHLLVHATYHMWQGKGRLIHLVDLAELADQAKADLFSTNGSGVSSLLRQVDARYTYPSLALLHRYFPAAIDETWLSEQKNRVSPTFRRWVDSLDLVNTSHLNPNPPGLYLLKALKFSEGRPREVTQALRFALLPSLAELSLDHPRLARSKAPWLAYFLLPLDWTKRYLGF